MLGFLSRQSKELDPHLEMRRGKGAILELWRDPRCSSPVETGILGNFLSCLKGFKDPFKAQEGRWDLYRDTTAEKGFIFG